MHMNPPPQWKKIKKAGMAPAARASFSMVAHKGRAFVFGGVSDNEAKGGEDLSSEFHNDLYQFNFEKQRWFAAELRLPKGASKQGDAAQSSAAAAEEVGTSASGDGAESGEMDQD